MSDQPTIKQLIKMMEFIGEYSFIIPSYNLPLPIEADGENYRPEKVFRLLRSGLMSYSGSGGMPKGVLPDINRGGIKPTQQWIDRAYIFLIKKVQLRITTKTAQCKMEHIQELLLRFNGLDFIDLPNKQVFAERE